MVRWRHSSRELSCNVHDPDATEFPNARAGRWSWHSAQATGPVERLSEAIHKVSAMGPRRFPLIALHRGSRVLLGTAALVAVFLAMTGQDPRWQKSIDVILAAGVLVAAGTHTRHWSALRTLVGGAAALLLAVSGVVAGLSVDEALGLISAAFLLSVLAWFLGIPERRASKRRAEETLQALQTVQAELAALRATLMPTASSDGR